MQVTRHPGTIRLSVMARFAIFLLPAAALAVTFSPDFEGGSLGPVQKVDENHYRLSVQGEKDQDGRNRQASWYYFAVKNSPKGELLLDMVDLPGEYNYAPNKGAITQATPPVISFDRKTWKHLEDVEYDASEPRLRLKIQAGGKSFWIAHVPPYTGSDLQALRKDVRRHSDFKEEVAGKSLEGREILVWTIHHGDPRGKKTIWLMFRQHSWESGSSWVGESAVRELLTPSAANLRSQYIWKVFPLCDPDGVARGGVRFNRNGFDLNRNWDVVDPVRMPEITFQRDAVKHWIEQGHSVDFYLSLHNTETAEYLQAATGTESKLAERLFSELTNNTSFAPSRALFAAAAGKSENRGRMTVIQGLHTTFGFPAFLMEQRIGFNQKLGHFPNIPDRLKFGKELVRAIAAAQP